MVSQDVAECKLRNPLYTVKTAVVYVAVNYIGRELDFIFIDFESAVKVLVVLELKLRLLLIFFSSQRGIIETG